MRVYLWAACFAVVSLFVVAAPHPSQAQSYDAEETQFLELINQYRAQNGVGPLELSSSLSVAAERHSEDMATYGFFSHTTQQSSYYPTGSTHAERVTAEGYPPNNYTGENIATGYTTAEEVLAAWQASPDHNAIMLDGTYKAIGIGEVGSYWTTTFGSEVTDGSASQPQPSDSGQSGDTQTPETGDQPASSQYSNEQDANQTPQQPDKNEIQAQLQDAADAAESEAASTTGAGNSDQYDAAQLAGLPEDQMQLDFTTLQQGAQEPAEADQYSPREPAGTDAETGAAGTQSDTESDAPQRAAQQTPPSQTVQLPPETLVAGGEDTGSDEENSGKGVVEILPNTGGASITLLASGTVLVLLGVLVSGVMRRSRQ